MEIEKYLPEIEGVSERQIWYAEQLRHKYIEQNEERFDEIYEIVTTSTDKRDLDYKDEHVSSFDLDFDDYEMAVLYGSNAGGIIATLKEAVEWK